MHTTTLNLGAFLLRMSLGTLLLAHGLLKVLVFTLPGTVGFFSSLGLPPMAAYLTVAGELLGGLALLTGSYTRLTALLMLPIMLGATWVHTGNGWVFSSPNGGWEFPALLSMLTIIVAIQGNGAYALRLRLPILDTRLPAPLKS
ncbi:MAG: DoxX family protein [Hahellaceae bacterium]|nr:DoxX family protein [Hahellaceae bacterium]